MVKKPTGLVLDALWALAYAGLFIVLSQTAHVFWYLPSGLRFAAPLLAPYRRWSWFIAFQVLAFPADLATSAEKHGAYGVAVMAATPIAAFVGPLWLRKTNWSMQHEKLASMARLLVAMAIATASAMLAHLYYPFAEVTVMSLTRLRMQLALGDYIGMLALVPVIWMVVRERPDASILRRWQFDIPCVLLPVLLLYAVLVARANEAQVFFFSALLCCMPSIYFAVRTGWRGAALALLAESIAVALSGVYAGKIYLTVEAQGFLAVAGSASLLLGATYDALRDSQQELQERNTGLIKANQQQDRLAGELRDAARRNLDTSEQVRRWITSELHDEIGQNLTALQTRVRLLERQSGMEGSELASEIGSTLMRMRQAVSGLMSSLRPAGLDDFGFAHALRNGAIRKLIETSDVAFDVRIDDPSGCLDSLDGNAQTALYRIVQEAATNTMRHANARRFFVRARVRNAIDGYCVLLAIADDGRGFDTNQHVAGIGLQGIRDRVLSLGGHIRLRSDECGTRMQVKVSFVGTGALT